MSHAPYSQVNRVDYWLFVVGSQTSNLIPDPSFGHNLCFRCRNEQFEPILDIYVPRTFQCYKEHHKPLSFDPYNRSLKFQQSTETPSPKVGVVLGVWGYTPSYSFILPHTFLHSQECVMWFSGFFLPWFSGFLLPWLPGFLLAHNFATPLLWSRAQS